MYKRVNNFVLEQSIDVDVLFRLESSSCISTETITGKAKEVCGKHNKKVSKPNANTKLETKTLPVGIKIVETLLMGVSHYGVFCSEREIKKGTRFGPFTGRNVLPKDIFNLGDTEYTWEVCTIDVIFNL